MSRLLGMVWTLREPPLPAVAALGLGEVALGLARLLRSRSELAAIAQVVVGPGCVCMLAQTDALPWIDGARYLGCETPGLYVPTTLAPALAPELIMRACSLRKLAAPLALIPDPAMVIPLGLARPIDPAVLDAWIADQEARA